MGSFGRLPPPIPSDEYIRLVIPEMISAIGQILGNISVFDEQLLGSHKHSVKPFGTSTDEPATKPGAPKLESPIHSPYPF